ncbi:MAG TPA: PKD domain-containing protein [candidate division Zixibacteria bacterium]|nr:PKD domain-containing protein [candidate division Zixibacteria bacterium]
MRATSRCEHTPTLLITTLSLFVALSATPATSHAQDGECGTVVTPEVIAQELALDPDRFAALTRRRVSAVPLHYVPITFHVVRRNDGSGGMSRERQILALQDLNDRYEPLGLRFFRYRSGADYYTHYINSDTYYFGTNSSAMYNQLRNEGHVPNTANAYFVPNTGLCGLANFAPSQLGVIVDDACVAIPGNASTFAHEVGHYFNLYHTHETAFGEECPEGSNCVTAGDLLCDTEADPTLSGRVSEVDCSYSGGDTPPASCSGEPYNPPTENLMSYSTKSCRWEFSPLQMAKMIWTLENQRQYLLSFDSSDLDLDGVYDVADNCPEVYNPDQIDADLDGYGDACLHASIDADPALGAVPHTVNFTGSSDLTVTDWLWDFGDGQSSTEQNPQHIYETPGIYQIFLTTQTVDSSFVARYLTPIVAVADTLVGDSVELAGGAVKARVDVYVRNTVPVKQMQIPFAWSGDIDMTLDSFSTAGLRTDYFADNSVVGFNPFGKQVALRLVSSADGSLPQLAPDTGAVVSLHFTLNGVAPSAVSSIAFSGWGSFSLYFSTDFGDYTPTLVAAHIAGPSYVCGDADGSGSVNIADVTQLLGFIFSGGPSPAPPEAGDADGSGSINVGDATYLIARIFAGGPDPVCP